MTKRYLKAILIGVFGVLISAPFLFGEWLPVGDFCVASNSEGNCQGLLSFLPQELHLITLIAVFGLVAFNIYESEN